MSNWISGDGEKIPFSFEGVVKPKEPENPKCGTVLCIAGWQAARMGYYMDDSGWCYKKKNDVESKGHASDIAAEALGFSTDDEEVFHDMSLTTPKKAANMLRKMAEKGSYDAAKEQEEI
jgi:hypothetical protein